MIALLTDFGLQDPYVGIIKGIILRIHPKVRLVDITHQVPPQDIQYGMLCLKSAYRFFPQKTIFLAVVDPGVGSQRKPIIVQTHEYIGVGPDNGILSPLIQNVRSYRIYEITHDQYFLKPVSKTFHGRDIFAPVAAHLAKGRRPSHFGPRRASMEKFLIPKPKIQSRKALIQGEIIHIDHFGNLITNIERHHIPRFEGLRIKIKNHTINGLSQSYCQAKPKQRLALFNSMGHLEIALHQASASSFYKLTKGAKVYVYWNLFKRWDQ